MSNTQITKTDLDNLKTSIRKPRIVREYHSREQVIEALGQSIPVSSARELADARRKLTAVIPEVLGTTRRKVRIQRDHIAMRGTIGLLTREADSMVERVKLGTPGLSVELSQDIARGVLGLWDARQR